MARGHNGDFMLGKRAIWEEGLLQNGQLCPKASAGFRKEAHRRASNQIQFNCSLRREVVQLLYADQIEGLGVG